MLAAAIDGLSPRVRGNPSGPLPPNLRTRSIPACAGEPSGLPSRVPRIGVYPRVCGGTAPGGPSMARQRGLSPRVRGNRGRLPARQTSTRSIPACAGEPWAGPERFRAWEVYPRVCGGTLFLLTKSGAPTGLSPRVRGNLNPGMLNERAPRSIPACAGEPGRPGGSVSPRTVYPRVCGGTWRLAQTRAGACGLSPRVRGNPPQPTPRPLRPRSIPACAGEPMKASVYGCGVTVYPRVCGGTSPGRFPVGADQGLSPRVRGNRQAVAGQLPFEGSIPACAGEPVAVYPVNVGVRVYPRVCGGTTTSPRAMLPLEGLSPRVRGNLLLRLAASERDGSIPACAGEPTPCVASSPHNRVYPRVCGGTVRSSMPARQSPGLSPRVRGNRPLATAPRIISRSIPACAGEPAISFTSSALP